MKSKSIYNERYVCLLFGGGVIVTWRLGSMQLEFWGRLLDILGLCFFVVCIWYSERGGLYGVSVGHLIISDTNFLETYVWRLDWIGARI